MWDKPALRRFIKERKVKFTFALATLAGTGIIAAASADIDWANITAIITGLADNLIPAMVTLVTAAVPLLVILAIVGFILAFLKRILDMLHFQL